MICGVKVGNRSAVEALIYKNDHVGKMIVKVAVQGSKVQGFPLKRRRDVHFATTGFPAEKKTGSARQTADGTGVKYKLSRQSSSSCQKYP